MIKWIFLMVLCIVFFGSIVPLTQFLLYKIERPKKIRRYLFSRELYDRELKEDWDELEKEEDNRILLSDRGWMRKPMGTILGEKSFEEKKAQEYDIELP